MSERDEYINKTANLARAFAEMEPPREVPVGKKVWVPCTGTVDPEKEGNVTLFEESHRGRVDISLGNYKFQKTKQWITQSDAEKNGMLISGSSATCPKCTKIMDRNRNRRAST